MKDALLIENCEVLTARGKSDFHSIFIRRGKIERLAVEATQEVPEGTARVDGAGSTVVPGLIDTHCHLTKLGESSRLLDLREVTNLTSLRLRLAARVASLKRGEWVVGVGWDQERFPGRRFPDRIDIDDVTDRNPTFLYRICGHVALLNSRAMEVLEVEAPAEEGRAVLEEDGAASPHGDYGEDENRRRTGIVQEAALARVEDLLPKASRATLERDILSAELEAAKNGLTTVHCILSSRYSDEIDAFASLHARGSLLLRYRLYAPVEALDYLETNEVRARMGDGSDEELRLAGIKIYADGTLGARTAALRRVYDDDREAGNRGMLRYGDEELAAMVARADELGYQVLIHAIGDRAIGQAVHALSGLPEARRAAGRHRIEHASLCPPDVMSMMKAVGARVSVQPYFAVSDTWAEERLGPDRIGDLYPFSSFLESEIVVSAGSDAPVEPISPILGLWAAMSRKGGGGARPVGRVEAAAGGGGAMGRARQLSLCEALRLYTTNAAENSFDETKLGDIREGLLADLTMIDSPISDAHPALIRRARVYKTIVGGVVVFSAEGDQPTQQD